MCKADRLQRFSRMFAGAARGAVIRVFAAGLHTTTRARKVHLVKSGMLAYGKERNG